LKVALLPFFVSLSFVRGVRMVDKKIEHRLVVRITPFEDRKPLTEKQIAKLVSSLAIYVTETGSNMPFLYGSIRVTDSINEEKKR
jgi:hypothetical protein